MDAAVKQYEKKMADATNYADLVIKSCKRYLDEEDALRFELLKAQVSLKNHTQEYEFKIKELEKKLETLQA